MSFNGRIQNPPAVRQ